MANKTKEVAAFTKDQLLASKRYASRCDALGVVLDGNEKYTIEQVDELLKNFMKGQVN